MPEDPAFDADLAERRLQRLERRYRRAQDILAGARAVYASLRETPGTSQARLHQAMIEEDRARRYVNDLLLDIETVEMQVDALAPGSTRDRWDGFGL